MNINENTDNIIRIENLTKRYDKTLAVDNVDFNIQPGKIYGLLGPNGAGKTTILRILTYIIIPSAGSVYVKNIPVGHETQKIMGYLPEERGLYKKVEVYDQLLFLTRLKGLSYLNARKKIDTWFRRFDIVHWKNKKAEELSKGMSQKIQFIAAVASDPEILIFDEPFSGFDPINMELIQNTILSLRDKGKTILISTHLMNLAEKLCDDICLINDGKIALKGNVQTIKQQYGNNTMKIHFYGDNHVFDTIDNVTLLQKTENYAEIRFSDDSDVNQVLNIITDKITIKRFEVAEPSLDDIYINSIQN